MFYQGCLHCRLEALRRESGADVEVAIDPEELEGLDDAAVKALYERRLADERARNAREVSSTYLSWGPGFKDYSIAFLKNSNAYSCISRDGKRSHGARTRTSRKCCT